jgi:spermidine synthase
MDQWQDDVSHWITCIGENAVAKFDRKEALLSNTETTPFSQSVLLLAFFLSGVSGLVYQVVWVRMLTRYLGSTTAATATVLCVFMGGLALGASMGGKIADRVRARLLGYAALEVGIALAALVSSFAIIAVLGGYYVDLYDAFGRNYLYLITVRVLFSMVCLLLPTILMGATLPILVAFVTHHKSHFQHGLGRLYSMNTFGAVLGVLMTGFFLIGNMGERSSLLVAALLNFIAACVAYLLQSRLSTETDISQTSSHVGGEALVPVAYSKTIRFWSKMTIFVSGFTALSYEIIWTRLLLLPLRTSIYAFSFMLALFLVGIAFGSWLSTRFSISIQKPVSTFAAIEVLIGFLTALGMLVFSFFGQVSKGFTRELYLGVLTCVLMVLPVAVAFGWQFPVAVRCCISDSTAPGKETGGAYFINTLGAILGSLVAGFILIPNIGTAMAMVMLGLLNILLGFTLFVVSPDAERGRLPWVAGLLACCFVFMAFSVGNPYKTAMRERVVQYLGPSAQMYAFYEGVAGTTVPAGSPEHPLVRHLFVNGIGMTSLVSETKLMAHLPLALVEDPKRVLVVCFGMGTTVRSASRFSSEEIHIDAVDIVPRVYDCFQYFHPDAEKIMTRPNINLYAEDGRNFLLVRTNLYDVITIDPAPPIHSAGTVNLYTREFLELCKSRIHEEGAVCLWLPPGPASELLMVMKTFVNVFPGASLWGGFAMPGFYLVGGHRSFEQTHEGVEALAKRLSKIQDLSEWDDRFKNPNVLRQLYLMGPSALSNLTQNSVEVTDDHPYTEFPMWRGVLSKKVPHLIFSGMPQVLAGSRGGTPKP